MSPAKFLSADQHRLLHRHWPDDCCLCHKEVEIQRLKEKIERVIPNSVVVLTERARILQEVLALRPFDCHCFCECVSRWSEAIQKLGKP